VEPKEGTLEATGADGDTEKSKQAVFCQMINVFKSFSFQLFTQHRHGSLGNRTASAVPAYLGDMVILERDADSDFVAAGGVTFGVLYGPSPLTPLPLRQERGFAAWVPVVVENVFGVEIHGTSG